MDNEYVISQQPNNHDITFSVPLEDGVEAIELIKLSKGKFYWKGEEVEDKQKVYERFCEWMSRATRSDL